MADFSLVNKKVQAVWPEWEVVGRVGCGTYGDVYKAKRTGLVECDAAIKLITIPKNEDEIEALGDDAALIERARAEYESIARAFSNEVRLLEVLKSAPNIVNIEDYSIHLSDNGCGWTILIRMELLTSLDKVVSISEAEAIKIGIDICTALEACSRKNIIHRDVKPSNIFVTDFGTYKLGDFGISRVLEANTTSLTMRSGTPRFMAPEVIKSMFYDARADIYSLGIVLYYLLNGSTSPFYPKNGVPLTLAERDEAELRRIRGEEFPRPDGLSDELWSVLLKACAVDLNERFQSASHMKKALMNLQASRYFDGVKVTLTDEVTEEVGEIAAIRRGIRDAHKHREKSKKQGESSKITAADDGDRTMSVRRAKNVVTKPWDDTEVVDIPSGIDNEESQDDGYVPVIAPLEDDDKTSSVRRARSDEDEAKRRAEAIAAGAAVTEAAKIAQEAKLREKNKKRAIGSFNKKKINIIGIIIAAAAVILFAVGAAIIVPMIDDIVGKPADTTNAADETIEAKPQSITIVKPANRLEYNVGDKISVDGLEIEAVYRFGKTETVSRGFTYSPTEAKGSGTQTVTVTYNGTSTTYEIEVKPQKIKSILFASMPERREFSIGEEIDFTGLILQVVYEDGSSQTMLSGFACTPTVAEKIGEQRINVTYGGKSASFTINVVERTVDSIELASLPERLTYFVGESLDTTGLRLLVAHSNGITASVSSGFEITPERFDTEGNHTVTVTYSGKSVEFDVNVTSAAVERISVRTMPTKTSYTVGETLSMSGFSLFAHYSDGRSEIITRGYTYTPTKLSSAGQQYVTVSYGGKKSGFNVTVNNSAQTPTATLTGISVRTNPSRTAYTVGDTLNISGLTLTARYSDGSTRTIESGFSCSPMTLSLSGNVSVNVSYGGYTASFFVNVSAPVIDGGECGKNVEWKLEGGVLTISGTGAMDDFGEFGTPWNKHANAINSIVIQNGVTSITSFAFAHTSAARITIPASVTMIDKTFAYNCGMLVEITVQSGNKNFSSEGGLLLSRDKTILHAYPIGKSETTFTVPGNVTTFAGYRLFCGSKLREIIITESLYSIDATAFEGALNLTKFSVRNRNVSLKTVDGVLYTKNMNALVCYPMGKTGSSFELAEGVTVIRESAFGFNPNLKSIKLPSTLIRIDKYAFYEMEKLEQVTYSGDAAMWDKIDIGEGNESLADARLDFAPLE